MRIVTNAISESVLTQIQNLNAQQARLQTEVSTGQKLTQPEDDPAAFGRVITLDTESRRLTQYQANAARALDVSQATYSSLQSIKTISDRAGEIATLGTGTLGADANAAYAAEVNQLIEQALQQGNSQLGKDYLFSGTTVSTTPFTATRNGSGQISAVAYNGNSSQANIQLSDTAGIAPGATGTTNSGIADFINRLVALRDALATGTPATVSTVQTGLQTSENLLVNSLSEQGAVQLRIQVNQTQQTTRASNLQTSLSTETDADMATSVTKLSQTSTAYQAALASATKVLQTSLLDYLK